MQYANSDLNHLVPLWERKLPDVMRQPIPDRFHRSNVDIAGSAACKDVLRDVGPLAQDRLRARIVCQGSIKMTLK